MYIVVKIVEHVVTWTSKTVYSVIIPTSI